MFGYTARKQAEIALATHVRQLEAVRAIATEISQELDLTKLLDLILQRALELIDAGVAGAVYLWDETAEVLIPRAWRHFGAWIQNVRLRLGEGPAGTIAQRREGLIINDYQQSPYAHPAYPTDITSAIGEPLVYRDQLIGVLVLDHMQTSGAVASTPQFTPQDYDFLALFARHAAVAIVNARLFEAAQAQSAQLATANDALQHEVGEHQRTEAALAQANGQLSARNTELNEFTRAASHDLQEPLRHVVMYCQLLQKGLGDDLSEDTTETLRFIMEGVERMQAMVQDILHFARAGRVEMQLDHAALDDCVGTALQALGFRIEATGARLNREDLPVVRGDRRMLTQLYQNLLGNALKFVGSDPPVLHLTAARQGGHWLLGVQDNGIGVAQEYAEQIFTPFQRLHSRGEYDGSGVGLATCRRIVERHGGRIWVEPAIGQGAHFRFTLPDAAEAEHEL